MAADLDLDLLRAFVAVSDTGSFTRAAQRVNRVQSAVSMQIKRLEEVVGQRLFDRDRRSVTLTGEGEQLLGYARRMILLNEEALSNLGRDDMAGTVRLGASDVASYLLPDILSRFADSYPKLQLEIHCDRSWHLLDAVEAGDLDLALVTQHRDRAAGKIVRQEPLVWAAARGHQPQELDPLPLAIFAPGCIYRDAALAALDACGRPWRIAYNSANTAGLQAAVSAGLAVTTAVQSSIGPTLQVLGEAEGFPPLPLVTISLHCGPAPLAPPIARLVRDIVGTWEAAPEHAA